jgi:hypothetical protein
MAEAGSRIEVPGSHRVPLPGARKGAPADPNERVEVSVLLRRPAGSAFEHDLAASRCLHPPSGVT